MGFPGRSVETLIRGSVRPKLDSRITEVSAGIRMKMRVPTTLKIWPLVLATVVVPASAVGSQQPYETPSLGALARQLREERAKEKRKPVPVFTNDDLRARSARQAESNKTAGPAKAEELSQPSTAPSPAPAEEYGEKYFRSKAEAIRSRLELHQRQLAVLEQQWGLTSTEYYPNPQKTLEEESTPTFHADTNKLRVKIEETKRQIADDQKAMADLRDELRRKGGDPGWIRQ